MFIRKHKVKSVFKPTSKISLFLPSPKGSLNPLSSKRVYCILCSYGAVYIDKTGRSVKTRLQEYQRCLRRIAPSPNLNRIEFIYRRQISIIFHLRNPRLSKSSLLLCALRAALYDNVISSSNNIHTNPTDN